MVRQTLAAHPKWQYLDPAWIMTIMDIESGNNPNAGPNGAGRYDGLMQVIPPTAAAMATLYGIQAGPQTNPMVSIQSGIGYLDDSARSIAKFRNVPSIPLWDLAQAYNEGFGAVEAWKVDAAYLAKFQGELPIIEAQMEATAMLTNKPSFVPRGMRSVMPISA
jgi:soluble lytic murein transglycosylase-like protein